MFRYSTKANFHIGYSKGYRMPRHLNLRQIEAFKAVVENGTVSRAAQIVGLSQPAMSKLIVHLEFDTGLRLFDRVKGRLAPTEHAMRLYDEVGRIFAGVRQVENAVEAIRREEQGRLAIGVLPALANTFIERVTSQFLQNREKVFCSVQAVGSQWIVEWLISRKLDVGLVSARVDNPYLILEPLMAQPLICIMPNDHPLTSKKLIEPDDLDGTAFVGFDPDIFVGHLVSEMFDKYQVRRNIVLATNAAPIICEFVAAGVGVSLVHPLMANGFEGRLTVRRFTPHIPYHFQLCRTADSRHPHIVEDFLVELRNRADQISREMLSDD